MLTSCILRPSLLFCHSLVHPDISRGFDENRLSKRESIKLEDVRTVNRLVSYEARVNNTFDEFVDKKKRNNILLKELVTTFGT